MLKNLYILLFIVVPIFSFSQQEKSPYYGDDFPSTQNEYNSFSPIKSPFVKRDNFKFRFTTGSSYANFYGNNIFSTYVMPEVNYKFNDKFSLSAGFISSYNYFPNSTYYNSENNINLNNKMYSYYIFARGEYQVNDNFRLRAATFFSPTNNVNQYQFSSYNIGFDVKIAEKTYFSADFNYTRTNQNFSTFYSPFGGYFDNFYTTPIGTPSFSSEW